MKVADTIGLIASLVTIIVAFATMYSLINKLKKQDIKVQKEQLAIGGGAILTGGAILLAIFFFQQILIPTAENSAVLMPSEVRPTIQKYMQQNLVGSYSDYRMPTDWNIVRQQKSSSPEHLALYQNQTADEVWCVVINPPVGDRGAATYSHFIVYRQGLRWGVYTSNINFDTSQDGFLSIGCSIW